MNRKLNLCTTILFTFIIFSLFFTSCKAEVDNRFYLDNFWQWDVGDDDGTAPTSIVTGHGLKKLAIGQEKNFANLFDDKTGYVWLRADFTLPEYLKNQDLGIFVGTIRMASQIYVNGKTVGSAGIFPPKEFTYRLNKGYQYTDKFPLCPAYFLQRMGKSSDPNPDSPVGKSRCSE